MEVLPRKHVHIRSPYRRSCQEFPEFLGKDIHDLNYGFPYRSLPLFTYDYITKPGFHIDKGKVSH